MKIRIFLAILIPLFCGACSHQSTPLQIDANANQQELIQCKSPRPEMCALNYLPVCAERDTGIRCIKAPCPTIEYKTYSNACSACSDPKVLGYKLDSCEAAQPTPSE